MYKCQICGHSAGNTEYVAKEMMLGLRDAFVYFQCRACECLQLHTPPKDLSRYYPPSYYSFRPAEQAPTTGGLRQWARGRRDLYAILQRGMLGRVLYRVSPDDALRTLASQHFPGGGAALVGLSRHSRLLDVGCGSGAFLVMLHRAGFLHVLGIDPHLEGDITYPTGLRILKRSLDDCNGAWDVVMFHHSFEHLPDPLSVLRRVGDLLSTRGRVIVRIPLVSSYAWQRYGVNWVQLDAPRHLFLHSRTSITRLARAAHLVIEKVVYDSSEFQFVGSELYEQGVPLASSRESRVSPQQLEAFRRQAAVLNATERGDQAAFYLRKG